MRSLLLTALLCALVPTAVAGRAAVDSSLVPVLEEAALARADGQYGIALALYQQTAVQGSGEAQFWLGYFYTHGTFGPQADTLSVLWRDAPTAIRWNRQAAATLALEAAAGHVEAAYLLGRLLMDAPPGVARNMVRARTYLAEAAAAEHPDALYLLGWYDYEEQGYPRALLRWRAAATLGHAHAAEMVGHLYLSGRGVAPDVVQYATAMRQAVDLGSPSAEASFQAFTALLHQAADAGDTTALDQVATLEAHGLLAAR